MSTDVSLCLQETSTLGSPGLSAADRGVVAQIRVTLAVQLRTPVTGGQSGQCSEETWEAEVILSIRAFVTHGDKVNFKTLMRIRIVNVIEQNINFLKTCFKWIIWDKGSRVGMNSRLRSPPLTCLEKNKKNSFFLKPVNAKVFYWILSCAPQLQMLW